MTKRWPAWTLCGVGLLCVVASLVLLVVARAQVHSLPDAQPSGVVLGTSFTLLGALILSRRPGNRIGWIYLLLGVAMAIQGFAGLYYEGSLTGGWAGGRWAAWSANLASLPVFPTGFALFAFLLYPSGRLPSPRWRRVAWAAGCVMGVLLLMRLLDPLKINANTDLPSVANPTGISTLRWLDNAYGLLYVVGLGLLAATIVGLARRTRHASAEERQQVKLLAYAASLTIGALALIAAMALVVDSVASGGYWNIPVVLGFGVAVPVACGFAILRHGLYDIDRLVSRTLSYALLTALLAGVFVGLVLLTTRVLPFSSPVGVAASTLAAAALFTPLRNRLQHIVDRRFNRARYDAEATVAAFGARLRDAVDPETVLTELARAASGSLQPAHVSVWVKAT